MDDAGLTVAIRKSGDGDFCTFFERTMHDAPKRFVLFLHEKDAIASATAFEIFKLSAVAEDADIAIATDIAIFKTSFLREHNLTPSAHDTPATFAARVRRLAGSVFEYPRKVATRFTGEDYVPSSEEALAEFVDNLADPAEALALRPVEIQNAISRNPQGAVANALKEHIAFAPKISVCLIHPQSASPEAAMRTIASVKRQSLENWELKCSAAAPDAATEKLFEELANGDRRISTDGFDAAREKGEYVMFLASGEELGRLAFERMSLALDKFSDADFAECNSAAKPGVHIASPEFANDLSCRGKMYRRATFAAPGIKLAGGIASGFASWMRSKRFFAFKEKWLAGEIDGAKRTDNEVFSTLESIRRDIECGGFLSWWGEFYKLVVAAAEEFPARAQDAAAILAKTRFAERREICLAEREKFFDKGRDLLATYSGECRQEVSLRERPAREIPQTDVDATIIVPVYNVELYVTACLASLLAQTHDNIEIICVDDGSADRSGAILDEIASVDRRVRVFHQLNSGVSAARNLALANARGRYVMFIDGDDLLRPDAVEKLVAKADTQELDMVFFDYEAFDYKTLEPMPQFWSLANQKKHFPAKDIFSLDDLTILRNCASCCFCAYRRSFLESINFRFAEIPLAEDLFANATILLAAKRISTMQEAFYRYRRNIPSGAASRLLHSASASGEGSQSLAIRTFFTLVQYPQYKAATPKARGLVMARLLLDAIYYVRNNISAARTLKTMLAEASADTIAGICAADPLPMETLQKLLAGYGSALDEPEPAANIRPEAAAAIERFDARRKACHVRDTVIVVSFLNDRSAERIDSWMFYSYLKKSGVPCKYVTQKNSPFYAKRIKNSPYRDDVIIVPDDALRDHSMLDEQISGDAFCRARAVVMEDVSLPQGLAAYLRAQDDCDLVFMQHGYMFTRVNALMVSLFHRFDSANVSSAIEEKFLRDAEERYSMTENSFRAIQAGLPRFDLLAAAAPKSESEKKVLLVSFTWRYDMKTREDFETSFFSRRISALMASPAIRRLHESGVRIVFNTHHALQRILGTNKVFALPPFVELCDTSSLSEYIRTADMLLTDYSSIAFDFLFRERPVLFWMPDLDDPARDSATHGDLVFASAQTAKIFNSVTGLESVANLLAHYAERNFTLEPDKRKIARSFFTYRSDFSRHLAEGILKDTGK
ncbi:MAG: glycosyltransferase [Kiritimatiellae bacterium]|nr:glycosyltransferase [Kiritimatiellia bacterium]